MTENKPLFLKKKCSNTWKLSNSSTIGNISEYGSSEARVEKNLSELFFKKYKIFDWALLVEIKRVVTGMFECEHGNRWNLL